MVKTCESLNKEGLNCKNRIREGQKYCWCHRPRDSNVVGAAKKDARKEFNDRLNSKIAALAIDRKVLKPDARMS
jgi:hypothetical protein